MVYHRTLAIMLEDAGLLEPALAQWRYLASREPSNSEFRRSASRVELRLRRATTEQTTVPGDATPAPTVPDAESDLPAVQPPATEGAPGP